MADTPANLIPDEYKAPGPKTGKPPLPKQSWAAIEFRLRHMPADWVDDALQEAAMAHLQGASPTAAVEKFRYHEQQHSDHFPTVAQLLPG